AAVGKTDAADSRGWRPSRSAATPMRPTPFPVILLALCSLAAAPATAPSGPPDLIVHHAKVVTVDPKFSIAQAMAVKAGKVQRVGKDDEILALKGPATQVLDLTGRTVLPGLIDSH